MASIGALCFFLTCLHMLNISHLYTIVEVKRNEKKNKFNNNQFPLYTGLEYLVRYLYNSYVK